MNIEVVNMKNGRKRFHLPRGLFVDFIPESYSYNYRYVTGPSRFGPSAGFHYLHTAIDYCITWLNLYDTSTVWTRVSDKGGYECPVGPVRQLRDGTRVFYSIKPDID